MQIFREICLQIVFLQPAWPNGYGVGLLNRRLGVRVPPWVTCLFMKKETTEHLLLPAHYLLSVTLFLDIVCSVMMLLAKAYLIIFYQSVFVEKGFFS